MVFNRKLEGRHSNCSLLSTYMAEKEAEMSILSLFTLILMNVVVARIITSLLNSIDGEVTVYIQMSWNPHKPYINRACCTPP